MAEKEKIVLSLLKEGNTYAFNKLYTIYSARLFNFALGICKNHEEAEEVVQQVFIKIWENHSDINPELSFSGYIFKIAKNILLNNIRKRIIEKEYQNYAVSLYESIEASPETEIDFSLFQNILEDIISRIPEKRKEVFLLSRNKNLTYNQIAEKLNISVNTINTQISKSLQFIRSELEKHYPSIGRLLDN